METPTKGADDGADKGRGGLRRRMGIFFFFFLLNEFYYSYRWLFFFRSVFVFFFFFLDGQSFTEHNRLSEERAPDQDLCFDHSEVPRVRMSYPRSKFPFTLMHLGILIF